MGDRKYFSLPTAARELGVSTDVLRQQYRNGLIPAIKTPGGQPRLSAETIEGIKQHGWPKVEGPANEGEGIQLQTRHEVVSQDQFTNAVKHPQIDEEELDFQTVRSDQACPYREVEPRRTQLDLFRFHQKWIDYARRLIPCWLTTEQTAGATAQIASEIKGRTPGDERWMPSFCDEIVRSTLLPLNRQREMDEARDAALHRVLAKTPSDATDSEKTRIQALARSAIQQAGEQVDSETLFSAAYLAIAPVLAAVELRRQRERLRAWALQKVPSQTNEKEQREWRGRMNRVLEQMNGEQDEMKVRDQLEEALEPILAAIPRRIDEERRRQRIPGLLSSAKLHIRSYLHGLYNGGELDYEAITDWEWQQELESMVVSELQQQLSGGESDEQVRKSVERILDDELEEADDDEYE